VSFITSHKDQPFFLYVPYNMPHIPIYASDKFAGTSNQGLYGDVVEELDWSVGEILRAVEENGLEEDTLIIFTSDNGPWLQKKENGGDGRRGLGRHDLGRGLRAHRDVRSTQRGLHRGRDAQRLRCGHR
jgi:arylsulfatase A-like enzyme